jgi:hypothetical protein
MDKGQGVHAAIGHLAILNSPGRTVEVVSSCSSMGVIRGKSVDRLPERI